MAKQSQAKTPTPPDEPRRHRRLRQEEERKQRILLIGTGIVIGAVVVLLAGALLYNQVWVPRQEAARQAKLAAEPIVTVNGESIDTAAFQRRLRFEQDQLANQINQYISFGRQFASQGGGNPFASTIQQLMSRLESTEGTSLTVLDDMIQQKVIAQLAQQKGIQASDDEVQQEIERQFGYERNPTPTPTPDPATPVTTTVPAATPMTKEAFDQQFGDVVASWQANKSLNEAEFRELIRSSLLRDRLIAVAPLDVQATEEQVHARHILISVKTPDDPNDTAAQQKADAEALAKIQEIRARIEKGEKFADVAKEVSDDTSNKDQGGDLGWFGRGKMVKEFEDVAFALNPGELSQPVKTQFGYHLIWVEEKDANHPVDAQELTTRRQDAFSKWLDEQVAAAKVERFWSAERVPALPDDLKSFLTQAAAELTSSAATPAAVTPAPAETPASTPAQ